MLISFASIFRFLMLIYNVSNFADGGRMTDLLYHTDAYLQEFETTVTDVLAEQRAVGLDRTAFYPGGGGQPCDFGSLTIDGVVYPVVKVKKQGDDVLHFLGADAPVPSPASVASGTLDWTRPY